MVASSFAAPNWSATATVHIHGISSHGAMQGNQKLVFFKSEPAIITLDA